MLETAIKERATRERNEGRKVVLERLGQRLADADLAVASVCLAHDGVFVTGNLRHFERVPGLLMESWISR